MAYTQTRNRLRGRTVLITGASSGIGRSTALEFARASPDELRLVLVARRTDKLNEIATEIAKTVGQGVQVFSLTLDVSDPVEACSIMDKLPAEFRDIDVLVNNAGLAKGAAKAPEISQDEINTMMLTNVNGLINITQAILPVFLKRENGGRGDIINVGSVAGREPYASGSVYCASKAAVRAFTDSIRRELVATRIRVIEIDPGQVETEFSLVRFSGDSAKAASVYVGCEPLTPGDIAELLIFAASRRENVVIADTLVYPNHQQGGAITMHRNL
ncbi:NAD(P)-binding protein [Phialemonium atrogriseum]|uniref:NAD(P)-binding protein n=1 Tax=Phialemonium atrogriseum TaxID=1093897 RepID=A0AAJ0BRU1_9PEZI|nr:NAD(P)-binding protein [Phialemonium atrogriseum]KAK1761857.1 NAD(P)-binding protein [Phialemonium atrogriseum]